MLCGRPHWGAWEEKMKKLFSMIIVAFVFTFAVFAKDGNEILGKYKSSDGTIIEITNRIIITAITAIPAAGIFEKFSIRKNTFLSFYIIVRVKCE